MNPVEEFDVLADEFYKETGKMAPGKDGAPAAYEEHATLEEWQEWLQKKREKDSARRDHTTNG